MEISRMAKRASKPKEYLHYHKDGSLWAKGKMLDGVMVGYWEWFRKDGTKMRSGHFENGQQVGEWITYDKKGKVYKVTVMKLKAVLNSKNGPKSKPQKRAANKKNM